MACENEGVKDVPSHNMPNHYIGYFKLKSPEEL